MSSFSIMMPCASIVLSVQRGRPEYYSPVPASQTRKILEVKAELDSLGSRCHIVRAAERGEEVVQRILIGQVDHSEPQTPLVPVAVEQIVFADGNVKQVTRSDARRILVVVFGAWLRYLKER